MPVRLQAQRVLVVILCALLFVPLLAAVPVEAADGDMYSYNGTLLPALPSWNTSKYPYAVIYWDSYLSAFTLELTSVPAYYGPTDVGPYLKTKISGVSYSYYTAVVDSWVLKKSSYASSRFSFCAFKSGDYCVWSNYDILDENDNSLFLGASDPIPAGIPTVPSLTTSFDGQEISLDAGSLRFFITATNVNGTLSCQWYENGSPVSGEWNFIEAEPGVWLQGWVYTPIGNGTRELYCIVTNTIGDKSESVSTGTVIVHYGVPAGGSGDLSEVTGKLDLLDMEIADLKNSVHAVQDSVDALPDKITDGIQDIVDQENEKSESEGNKFVDQITGLVPNDSQGFIDSMGSLVNVLSYDGTDCVLTIPALTIPAIEPHFSEFTVLESQQLDFEQYINMMPPNLLLLIRSLLTGALIVYCFKELYGVISYFFVLKGGET